jgi:hypothetical protein
MVSLWLNNTELKFIHLLIENDEYADPLVKFDERQICEYDEMRDKLKKKVASLHVQHNIAIPGDGQWDVLVKKRKG